ncbi:AI-2E family transporter [Pseudorhodoferax sp. Leaf267]|uniref:AI-2E family transporter n=1 Tax=Pseudorhodoferax sp. Leaf267 TaxID=1736316 RepID=UPI000701C411|nr:AI-2E family transporter [Pseudorhodoferax sp. Leaf267]KQP21988.1 permease [Pseudorhodoferax sp. Leaf267]
MAGEQEQNPPAPDSGHVLPDAAVNMRNASLAVLTVLACVFALQWAAPVFIPLMLSLLLTYALSPAVVWLARWHISPWIGSAVVLLSLVGAMGWTAWSLSASAGSLLDSLPVAAQKLRLIMLSGGKNDVSALQTVQQAAAQLEQAAEASAAKELPRRGVTRVVIERPRFNVRDYLWTGTVGLMSAAAQMTMVVFLTYFALGSGTTFRRKLVKISGASLQKKKITVHVLDDIAANVERYLLVQILTSALVGVATGLTFWAFGLDNAAVWGIVAGVTNLIPYLGSMLVMVGAGLLALLQFNSYETAALIAGSSLLIHMLVGQLLVPFLTSRTSRMNPVAVFVGVIFWGWLWGIPGLLLGIPIMMVIKAVCDHVEDLQPIGELLSD